MTVFHCFRDSKCEWDKGLRDFAEQFNTTFNTEYSLSKCLDVSDSTQNQPEVLLESTGDKCMVIECKKIVYPPNYFKNHRLQHQFFENFKEAFQLQLKPKIPLDIYEIAVHRNSIFQRTERKASVIANQIVNDILNHLETFLISGKISADSPIPWYFRQLPSYERDEDTPESGLRVSFPQECRSYACSLSEARQEISNQLSRILKKVEIKFKNYSHCLKILVLEICGESFLIPEPDTIDDIINQATLPPNLDQIWLAEPDWISDLNYSITYRQVR